MAILGMWMWPQSVRRYGAGQVAAYCARSHVTDIYFLTKGLGGTMSCHSDIAPGSGERDPLAEMLDAAHPLGIRVHAWFTSASDEHYKALHPQSGRCHLTRGRDKGLISLADAGYLAYMQDITQELCRRYPIDGLHLDYIRYNHLVYGWGEEDLARYAANGADPRRLRTLMEQAYLTQPEEGPECLFSAYRAGDESVLALARTRRQDVARFAGALTSAARAVRSDLILSAALMPEGAYDDLAFSDLHYGQNYEDAANLYDFALPMAYSKAYDKDAAWVRTVAEGTLKRGMRTIMGLHAYDGGTGPSLQEEIAALQNTPIDGICLFREGATALAYAREKSLAVYNPLDAAITRVEAVQGGENIPLACAIAPGQEHTFLLPFAAESLRIFAGEREQCVYLTKE